MHAHPKLQVVLSILIILFVSGCGGSARTFDLARACIVTKQPDPPFVPPAPYPVTPDANSFWLGTNALWTALPLDGTWKGLSHYTPNDPTFRQVTFWWRQGYDAHAEPQPNLTVTGTRLDLSATLCFPARLAMAGCNRINRSWMSVSMFRRWGVGGLRVRTRV